ncbi:MAG TPA: S53 family peptidase [Trebonia sp.]
MRFRPVMAAVIPAGAAAVVLAILPVAASAAAAPGATAAGHLAPAVSAPLAYRLIGKVRPSASTGLFPCQEPGAATNCYTPQELATAYDIPARLNGAGQTIVAVDAFGDPTLGQDLAVEDSTFGLPKPRVKVIYPQGKPAFNPKSADEVNWTGEISLDVESVHAIAPAATIVLVVAKSDNDPDMYQALQYTVKHRLGSVLSLSYGEAESCEARSVLQAEHQLFATAAARGVSVFASSGDTGAAEVNCKGTSYFKSVDVPAADPLVTGVGATSLTAAQPSGRYQSERAWNNKYGASGGGYSRSFPRPSYQAGLVSAPGRGVPDVAYSGDTNNGLLIAWSEGSAANVGDFATFGGTSAGSPQWAAITALADQAARKRLGLLNSRLYALARSSHYHSVFHDVTAGSSTVTLTRPNGGTVHVTGYPATKGWDAVTGLGTPDVAQLLRYLH